MQQRTDRVSSQADEAPFRRLASAWAPARQAGRATLALLAALGALLTASAAPAGAAVTHTYLPEVSRKITEGPTNGKGEHERVSRAEAMAGDSGHVWLAERVEYAFGASRVDEFDAESGEYLKRQLIEEEGVASLTEGVAVGHAFGEEVIYLGAGKAGKGVVAAYGPTDILQAVWEGAHTANKSFTNVGSEKVGVLNGVAVDNSANPETNGDVYVATRAQTGALQFNVIDVLRPEAGGKEGASVGQISGTCASPGSSCPGSEVPFSEPRGVAVGPGGDVLVLDGNFGECAVGKGICQVDVFAPEAGAPGVYKFLLAISGTPSGGAFKQPERIAVDSTTGDIYVGEKAANVVYEFDGEGKFLGRLAGTPTGHGGALVPFREVLSAGVDPGHNVLVADYDQEKAQGSADAFGKDVVIPDVEVSEPPIPLEPEGATLHGKLNPDSEGPASCAFEYGTSTAYGQSAPCTAEAPNGNALVAVQSQPILGLSPDTTYHYRLDASNKNGTSTGECPTDCGQFTTSGPGISGESVVEVSSDSARLHASIDPNKASTSYYFQYSTASTEGCGEPGACTELPAAPGVALGAGEAPLAVSQHAQGLSADTLYHYRVVALSAVRPGEPFFGPDQTFRTQLAGANLKLADGRQWELVSPANKQGSQLSAIETAGIVQAAAGGQSVTYLGTRPTEAGVQGYFEGVQVISRRGEGGWSSEDVSLAHAGAVGTVSGNGSEYRFFSGDLTTAVVEPIGEFSSLAPCVSAPESERTPYIRHNDTPCEGRAGLFDPLVSAEDTPPGTKFGGQPTAATGPVSFVGASADATHVVLSSPVALTPPPKEGEITQVGLYEWAAGAPASEALKLVSVLPDGKLAPGQAQLGYEGKIARGAISEDGTRVAWSEANGHLYVRDMAIGKTVQLDLPEGKCLTEKTCGGGEVAPVFQAASSDGSHVFFTDKQRLVADAGELPGKADLYECEIAEVEGQLACRLTDLTPVAPGSEEGADVQGIVPGIGQDGASVYFVANGALAEGAGKGACHESKPPPGASCNLYVRRREGGAWTAPRLVAVLGGEDWPDWKGEAQAGLGSLTAQASSDGRYLAFMSDRSLSGYDNRDALSGKPDQEVFLYDAAASGGAGRLACASCDPSGARPEGVEYGKLKDGLVGLGDSGLWDKEQGIAASVPGWTAFQPDQARYQSRYLTEQGRLFFDSADALAPQDVNHNQDAYQFEPAGVGDCTSASPGFNAATGGCVSLISSGAAAGESAFIDASQGGNDVFFVTGERLVKEDLDTALDVYDAHVCSAAAPCFSEVEGPPPCSTADSCRAPASPQPSIFGAPASATFSGAGNLTPAPAPKPPTTTPTPAQRLAAALKACRKQKSKKRRIACERKARKRYPVKKASALRSAKGKGRKR